jgi:hypothetical protein
MVDAANKYPGRFSAAGERALTAISSRTNAKKMTPKTATGTPNALPNRLV